MTYKRVHGVPMSENDPVNNVLMILQGFYDFVVLINPGWSLPVAAAGILLLWVWRLKLLHALHLDAINRED